MKRKIGVFFLAFLIATLAPIEGAYGIQFSVAGGDAGSSGTASMNIRAEESASVTSEVSINKAIVAPTTRLIGATSLFEETHGVKDSTGKSASVYVKVANAPNGLTYSSQVLPGEGSVAAQPSVSAEQWLTVPKADSIITKATSSYGTLSSDVGLEETKGSSTGDFVTLNGYDGKAFASASSVSASQTATSGSANSIKIYGDAKDSSGSYSINTPLTGISGGKATFNAYPLNAQSSAGTITQVTQTEFVSGGFTSKLSAGTKTNTRTSNYGTDYDLSMMAAKSASGPSVSGVVGYHVSPTTSANKIQSAVTAAQSGDWINIAAGTYKENIKIDKSLTLNGYQGAVKTIVNGQLANSVLTIGQNNHNIDVALSGMTITGGIGSLVSEFGDGLRYGGGIANYGRMTLTDSILTGNKADRGGSIFNKDQATATIQSGSIDHSTAEYGGGIFNINSGVLNLNGVSVSSNTANYGGGVFNDAGTMTLNSGTISNNKAVEYAEGGGSLGGGIIQVDGGTFTQTGGSISSNSADNGGGIYNDKGTVNLKGGSIDHNTANTGEGYGGGIYNRGALTQTGGSISYNSALYSGGGLYNDGWDEQNRGVASLLGGSIDHNHCDNLGGGVAVDIYGTVIQSGSIITTNTAPYGGGIYNDMGGKTSINSGSIDHNIASLGGGVFNVETLTQTGGSISSNSATSGGGMFNDGMVSLNGGSIDHKTATSWGGGIANDVSGTVTQSGSSITYNTANRGGGIYIDSNAIVNLIKGSIDHNTAVDGGGIDNYAGTMNLNGGSISSNTATGTGGGIINEYGTVNLNSGSIDHNTAKSNGGGITNDVGIGTVKGNTVLVHDNVPNNIYVTQN